MVAVLIFGISALMLRNFFLYYYRSLAVAHAGVR
jgi:hypothetical protein